jgi:hypothetical protein
MEEERAMTTTLGRIVRTVVLSALAVSVLSEEVSATTIFFGVENLGGNTWEYAYTIENDTLGFNIEEFTIYFEHGLYDNLLVTTPMADWDELAVNPDVILGSPEDGFFDALALGSGIAPGQTLSGFSVSFDWLGAGSPGTQTFEVVDPDTFVSVDSGDTAPIPEPATSLLLGAGLAGLVGSRIKKRLQN